MEKVLVTDGLGLIGYQLCERLLLEGIEVVAVDQCPTEKRVEQEEKEMRLGRNALLTTIHKRIEQVISPQFLQEFDIVFHLADPFFTEEHSMRTSALIEKNSNVIKRILRSLTPNTRFIYTSSVAVY